MKKVLFVLLFFILSSKQVLALDPNFDISAVSRYEVDDDGETEITQNIKITNKSDFYYTPTYTVSVGFSDVENIQAYNSDGTIPTTLNEGKNKEKSIKLSFPNRYAGLNESNNFTLKFTTKDVAKKAGNIWEITIPGIEKIDDFNAYTAEIVVPESFGSASIVKPIIDNTESKKIVLSKEEIGKAGVYILYGDKQYYSFSLKYNISNPNLFPVRTEIALPPQTGYQNVIISSFSEHPLNTTRDLDGNWIAEYRLLPQQKKSVIVKGFVEVLPNPSSETLTNVQKKIYTSSRKHWDSTTNSISEASKKLKTPKEIYDFTVDTLTYNYSKIATDNLRLGGSGALSDPKNSVCLEFSDLFISLARANGIPARSVEGYAYTQNSKLRPLSLVNDILHAWPEYYDFESKKWIMVDPTWGNTTKGMDYFTNFDFSHVTFAIKGQDSEYPIPAGGYKFNKESKDVEVKFADASDFKPQKRIAISDSFPNFSFPKMAIQGNFEIKNTGNAPLSNLTVHVKSNFGTSRQFDIDYIPPAGAKKITTTFSDIPFLTNGEYLITIQVGEQTHNKAVRISFIPDMRILLLIGGLIGGSIIIAAVTFHTGSVLVQRRKRKNSLRR